MQKADTSYPSLKNKVVLITGGASGIGENIVWQFCQQQANVAFIDNDKEKSERLVNYIESQGFKTPRFVYADVTNVAELETAIEEVVVQLGSISVLVNNVANDERHYFDNVDELYFDNNIAVNLKPYFFASKYVIPHMRKLGGGSIINLGSDSWRLKQTDMPVYTTAKAAIEGLTVTMAAKFGQYNIRVNTLVPGWVMTKRQREKWATPDIVEQVKSAQCIHKSISPDDIAMTALFLASNDSKLLTAQTIAVDAGWR